MDAKPVADFFINKSDSESGDVITHLRLQKLVYYAQAWHLALKGEPLITDEFQAWAHGPVCPTLWHVFKEYGWDAIPQHAITTEIHSIPTKAKKILEEVWRVYGQFSAKRLEELTHSEDPWRDARGNLPECASCNKKISQAAMKSYYRSLLPNG